MLIYMPMTPVVVLCPLPHQKAMHPSIQRRKKGSSLAVNPLHNFIYRLND